MGDVILFEFLLDRLYVETPLRKGDRLLRERDLSVFLGILSVSTFYDKKQMTGGADGSSDHYRWYRMSL